MRIAYLSNNISIHDWRFLSKISAAGHEVFLFTHHNLDDPRIVKYYDYVNPDVVAKIKAIPNLKVVQYFPWLYIKSPLLKKLQLMLHLLTAPFLVRRKFKALQCDMIDAGYIQRDGIVAALSGVRPFLLTTWGSDVLLLPKRSSLFRLMAAITIRNASLVYSDSNVVRAEVMKLGTIRREKTVVFPQLGIDISRFSPGGDKGAFRRELGFAQNDKVIISIRHFDPRYNIPGLIEAVARLRDITREPFKVLLIGKGPSEQEVIAAIKKYDLAGLVKILGYVENEKMPRYLASSDICVSSALTDGTPLSLLEAMACALPLVVTDVESYFEWIKDGVNGFIVPRRDANQMADRLARLLADMALCGSMGKINRSIAEERADIAGNFLKLDHCYRYITGRDATPPAYD